MEYKEFKKMFAKYNRMAIDIYMCQFLYDVKLSDEFLKIVPALSQGRKRLILFSFHIKKIKEIEHVVLLSRKRIINLDVVMNYVVQEKYAMKLEDILKLKLDRELTNSVIRIGSYGINILKYCDKYFYQLNNRIVNEFSYCKILKINIDSMMKDHVNLFGFFEKKKAICLRRYTKFLMKEFDISEFEAKSLLEKY